RHVYETFSADRPELIRDVHLAYLQAGARCLTTNTFAASAGHLRQLGEADRSAELNRAAALLCRQVIDEHGGRFRGEGGPLFVLGSVGPTLHGDEPAARIPELYRGQVEALVEAGVDALLLETFSSLDHLRALLDLVASLGQTPPVVAEMALTQVGRDGGWDTDPVAFVSEMAARGAVAAGVNCCSPWTATAFVDAVADLPAVRDGRIALSVMPNAGGFQRIGNRYMTHVNAEFMGRLARALAQRGVRLIGGCCEVHPPHIREMHSYLQGRAAADRPVPVTVSAAQPPADAAHKRRNGPLSRKLADGEFAVSVELLPSRGTAPGLLQGRIDFVGELAASGLADAVDVTDGSRGIPLMPPGDFINVLRRGLGWTAEAGDGLELIPHFTARDLNTMGIQSRLIGYFANRIHNVLFVTGDPPKMSPTYPRSTAVFDLDSVAMIRLAHTCLNAGVDFGGQPLGKQADPRTHFTIGTGFEPEALDLKGEVARLERKIEAGADYVMTQPAFRNEALAGLGPYRRRIAILVGVLVLTGLDHARRMAEVPGVVVPQAIFERLAAAPDPRDQHQVGVEIAAEQVAWIRREGWAGLYLMSPASHRPVLEVLTRGLT
ncbi:MAG: homocysteine S-methyltransferase family protein, partial [Gemmatimonadota bacterium]